MTVLFQALLLLTLVIFGSLGMQSSFLSQKQSHFKQIEKSDRESLHLAITKILGNSDSCKIAFEKTFFPPQGTQITQITLHGSGPSSATSAPLYFGTQNFGFLTIEDISLQINSCTPTSACPQGSTLTAQLNIRVQNNVEKSRVSSLSWGPIYLNPIQPQGVDFCSFQQSASTNPGSNNPQPQTLDCTKLGLTRVGNTCEFEPKIISTIQGIPNPLPNGVDPQDFSAVMAWTFAHFLGPLRGASEGYGISELTVNGITTRQLALFQPMGSNCTPSSTFSSCVRDLSSQYSSTPSCPIGTSAWGFFSRNSFRRTECLTTQPSLNACTGSLIPETRSLLSPNSGTVSCWRSQ